MKCPSCQRNKGIQLTCRDCTGKFCTGCIQLEVHNCPKLSQRIETEQTILEKKLVKVEGLKILKI